MFIKYPFCVFNFWGISAIPIQFLVKNIKNSTVHKNIQFYFSSDIGLYSGRKIIDMFSVYRN